METHGDGGVRGKAPERARSKFRLLLAPNPNYFGSFPDLGLKVVEPKAGDTGYEELDRVSYSPERDRVEATVLLKRSFGYSGDLCTRGSFEYVRFYIDYGTGWEDAGVASVKVHEFPMTDDCAEKSSHPSATCAASPTGRGANGAASRSSRACAPSCRGTSSPPPANPSGSPRGGM